MTSSGILLDFGSFQPRFVPSAIVPGGRRSTCRWCTNCSSLRRSCLLFLSLDIWHLEILLQFRIVQQLCLPQTWLSVVPSSLSPASPTSQTTHLRGIGEAEVKFQHRSECISRLAKWISDSGFLQPVREIAAILSWTVPITATLQLASTCALDIMAVQSTVSLPIADGGSPLPVWTYPVLSLPSPFIFFASVAWYVSSYILHRDKWIGLVSYAPIVLSVTMSYSGESEHADGVLATLFADQLLRLRPMLYYRYGVFYSNPIKLSNPIVT